MASRVPSRAPASRRGNTKHDTGKPSEHRDCKRRSFMINSCKFAIDAKYTPLKPIGRGAYGVVCSAINTSNNKKVAIKKITGAFEDLVDAKRILREAKLLRHFKHENIVGLCDMMNPPLEEPFEDVYIVLDLMDTDLERIISSNNELTDHHVQYFIYQVLRGLKYIHSANVIHRDLKPSNLLLNADCDLKICDFGLARGVKDDVDLTKYVVTRWYRAPELLCSCTDYDEGIDVWSVGCILAELLGRTPLFPGQDYINQMDLIFSCLGTPTADDTQFISNEKAYQYIKRLKKRKAVPFKEIYPQASDMVLDLLKKMLMFSPRKRITVEEALNHPYLADLHLPESAVECKEKFDFDFENHLTTKKSLQAYMYEEVKAFRPEVESVRRQMGKEGLLGKGFDFDSNLVKRPSKLSPTEDLRKATSKMSL